MQKTPSSSRRMILGGFFALLTLSFGGVMQQASVGPTGGNWYGKPLREAQEFRSTYRLLKRLRTDRLGECSSLDQEECLDLNDAARQLQTGNPSFLHEAAPATEIDGQLELDDLSLRQHAMLLQFVQGNHCPTRLDEVLPGLYVLCTRLLTDHPDFRPYFTERQMRQRGLRGE